MKQDLQPKRELFQTVWHKLYLNQLRLKIMISGSLHVKQLLWLLKKDLKH